MRVEVLPFAALREALGAARVTVELSEGSTGVELREVLASRHPRYRGLILACRLAQGTDFLEEGAALRDGDEVVLIPPVSGGSAPPTVRLTPDPLDGDELKAAAYDRGAGAVALFEGTARTPSRGREVRYLEYEAYQPMALAQMERIVEEARGRWPVTEVFLHHRLGRVEVGEVSVVAVASAPHRAEAFEACRHLIERLKADVPIWKKEVFADGSAWVGAPGECAHEEDA
jgi:molybdopterin synthase catalytic subunit